MGSLTFELETSAGVYGTVTVEHYESTYYNPQPGTDISLQVTCGDQSTRDTLIDLMEAAGQAAFGTDIEGTGWYLDRIRPDANLASVSTLITTNNLPELDGLFGVCVGGEDETLIPGSRRGLTIDIGLVANPNNTSNSSLSDFQSAYEVSVP